MHRSPAFLIIALLGLVSACSSDQTGSETPGTDGQSGGTGAGGFSAQAGSGGSGTSGEGGDSGQGGGAGTSTGGTGETGGSSPGEGGSSGSAGSAPAVPVCQLSCGAPEDCTTAGSYPASEWNCVQGLCRYLGCSSDDTCSEVFKNDGYVCRPSPGTTMNLCQKKCSTASDCALDAGAWSANNWNCAGDYCVYKGCTSDLECKTSMAGLDFRCRDMPDLGYKSCVKGCYTPADCAVPNSPAWAAATYECTQGACEYLGCPGDTACQQSMNSPKYVCK